MSIKGKCSIVGLGVTAMGKVYGRSATDFAAEAIHMALEDAGLKKEDVDGLLINCKHVPRDESVAANDTRLRGSVVTERHECLWLHSRDDDPVRMHGN